MNPEITQAEKVKRFHTITRTTNGVNVCSMMPSERGHYVKYTDYAKLQAEADLLRRQCGERAAELIRLKDELYTQQDIDGAYESGKKVGASLRASAGGERWVSVEQELPPLDAENCCMGEADYGRFSDPVIVFDEDEACITSAVYDANKEEWSDARNGGEMFGITHWKKIAPPTDKERL